MDWLDRLSMAAIGVLILVTVGMLAHQEMLKRRRHNPGSGAKEAKQSYALQMEADKKLYSGVDALKKQGRYGEAVAKLENIMRIYPDKSLSYVYLAQVLVKQGKLGDAIHNYRRAVEMEPDYVDERTPVFIGKDLKAVVEEGREKFGREKTLKPNDDDVKQALEDVYYLQRRLAGGCE
jgi:tetratricopeptide (TPR) repeat protein